MKKDPPKKEKKKKPTERGGGKEGENRNKGKNGMIVKFPPIPNHSMIL